MVVGDGYDERRKMSLNNGITMKLKCALLALNQVTVINIIYPYSTWMQVNKKCTHADVVEPFALRIYVHLPDVRVLKQTHTQDDI